MVISLVIAVSCQSRSKGNGPRSDQLNDKPLVEENDPAPENRNDTRIGKALFFIENSGSMLGYVSKPNEFMNSIVSLSYLPGLDNSDKSFYFINGTAKPGLKSKISTNYISNNPENLKEKLNPGSFKTGDPRFSDLNRMFEIALDSVKEDRITILISDCIYDVGEEKDPLMALKIETQKTQQAFRRRIDAEDIQTLILKAYSNFGGRYYFASKKGSVIITDATRPYYILFFGNNELLNNNITKMKLGGRIEEPYEMARFISMGESSIPYQIVPSVNRKGNFRPDPELRNRLTDASPLKGEFQFAFAADFNSLSFLTDDYLTSVENYYCSNPNFNLVSVEKITKKIPGVDGTHLITVSTNKSPLGDLEIVLKNSIPSWVSETNADNEDQIDNISTFGFKYLTGAISRAYEEKNSGKDLAAFKIIISR